MVRSETGCGYYNYEQNKWLTSAIYEGESEKASDLKNLFLKRGKIWDIFNKNGVQLGSFKADYILSAKGVDFCVYGFENEEKIVTLLGIIDDKGKIIREPFLSAFRYGDNKTFQGKYIKDEAEWRNFEWKTGNEVKNALPPEESKRN